MISRRCFLATATTLIAEAALAQTKGAAPRGGGPRRIGYLSGATADANADYLGRFRASMASLHWREGKDYEMLCRYADGNMAALPSLAMELVAGRPDVILTPGYLSTKALANINQHIPMVFFLVIDPVGTGLVSSLSKPGGNLTGITDVSQDLSGKRVQLLKEAIPKLSHLAIVFAPGIASNPGLAADAEQTARALGVRVTKIELRETTDVDTALLRASSAGAQAFVVFASGYTQARRSKLVDDSLRYRLAGSYYDAEFVANGGFMSYAASPDNIFQRVASMVDKILRGAHPGDIPVEQPTSFELKINLKSAERLEIPIPESLKLRAELVQ